MGISLGVKCPNFAFRQVKTHPMLAPCPRHVSRTWAGGQLGSCTQAQPFCAKRLVLRLVSATTAKLEEFRRETRNQLDGPAIHPFASRPRAYSDNPSRLYVDCRAAGKARWRCHARNRDKVVLGSTRHYILVGELAGRAPAAAPAGGPCGDLQPVPGLWGRSCDGRVPWPGTVCLKHGEPRRFVGVKDLTRDEGTVNSQCQRRTVPGYVGGSDPTARSNLECRPSRVFLLSFAREDHDGRVLGPSQAEGDDHCGAENLDAACRRRDRGRDRDPGGQPSDRCQSRHQAGDYKCYRSRAAAGLLAELTDRPRRGRFTSSARGHFGHCCSSPSTAVGLKRSPAVFIGVESEVQPGGARTIRRTA